MISTQTLKLLADRVELFKGLNVEDIGKIFTKGMTVRYRPGESIFLKGSTGNKLYVVLGGTVRVADGNRTLATLTMGDMFGEMALINREPRTASAHALEATDVFVLDETAFHKLLTKRVSVQILLNIIHVLSHRLSEANKRTV